MEKYSNEEISKIKESAKIILDLVETCQGGSSWLKINDVFITCDTGYVLEFCEKVLDKL